MSREDDRADRERERERPKLRERVGQGLSFMNKLALVILVLGCLAVLFKHR